MYVDEFQNFATDSFASILSEARKYRLSLTLAHQYIGQLVTNEGNTKVRDAVFGNVGTIITFRVGAADGESSKKNSCRSFCRTISLILAKANIYIKLMIDGVSSKPFSATTLPPHIQPLVSYKDIIIKNTRAHYAVPRKIVDERIASEWNGQSDAILNEKLGRRDEKPLSQVLRPDARSSSSSPDSRPRDRYMPPRSSAPSTLARPSAPTTPNDRPATPRAVPAPVATPPPVIATPHIVQAAPAVPTVNTSLRGVEKPGPSAATPAITPIPIKIAIDRLPRKKVPMTNPQNRCRIRAKTIRAAESGYRSASTVDQRIS